MTQLYTIPKNFESFINYNFSPKVINEITSLASTNDPLTGRSYKEIYYKQLRIHQEKVVKYCMYLNNSMLGTAEVLASCKLHDSDKIAIEGIYQDSFIVRSMISIKLTGRTLSDDAKRILTLAVDHHRSSVSHHLEYYDCDIKEIPELVIDEVVSDWLAVAEVLGSEPTEWFKASLAANKFRVTGKNDIIFEKITKCIPLLSEYRRSNKNPVLSTST